MRIVSGSARGRIIAAPSGRETRPTTDRVREALFSSLFSQRGSLEGAVVLDAFAGSGALGLEALSRGASRAVFFDDALQAQRTLRKNLQVCGFAPQSWQVEAKDVLRFPPASPLEPFDIVFCDPPYAFAPETVLGFLKGLAASGALAEDAIVVYEHSRENREAVSEVASREGFVVSVCKEYGKSMISFLKEER